MNGVFAGALSALVIGIPGWYIALVTLRNNRRAQEQTNKLETRKVEQSEFETIKKELRDGMADLREELREERAARERAEQRAERAEQRAERTERKNDRLTRRVEQLEQLWRAKGEHVPPADDAIGVDPL